MIAVRGRTSKLKATNDARSKTASQRLAALSREDRQWLREATTRIESEARQANDALVRIGRELIRVRSRIGQGLFLAWLAAKFPWSQRTAYRLIDAANAFGTVKPAVLANLDQYAMHALSGASVPAEVRAEAIAMARRGERVTHARAAGMVRAARGETGARPATAPPGLERALDNLDEMWQCGEMVFTGDADEPAAKSISLTYGEYKLLLNRLAPELFKDAPPPPKVDTPPPGSGAKAALLAARAAFGQLLFSPDDQLPDARHIPAETPRGGGAGRTCPACGQRQKPKPVVADEWSELHGA